MNTGETSSTNKKVSVCASNQLENKHYCPKCRKERNFIFYAGWLGYASFVCPICNLDINDLPNFILKRLDKLHGKGILNLTTKEQKEIIILTKIRDNNNLKGGLK